MGRRGIGLNEDCGGLDEQWAGTGLEDACVGAWTEVTDTERIEQALKLRQAEDEGVVGNDAMDVDDVVYCCEHVGDVENGSVLRGGRR